MSFCITSFAFPFTLWAQTARGWTPTQSALLMVPMALMTGFLAPVVGRLTDRVHPRILASTGFLASAVALIWLTFVVNTTSAVWEILATMALFGLGSAFLWAPLAATATRNLPMSAAGAGSGVYNATRQVGAVLGSAAIAAVLSARLTANLGPMASAANSAQEAPGTKLPPQVGVPFSTAMSQSLWLPVIALLVGLFISMFFEAPGHRVVRTQGKHEASTPSAESAPEPA